MTAAAAIAGMKGPSSPSASRCHDRSIRPPSVPAPSTATNMPPRCSPQPSALMARWINAANDDSDGSNRSRTSQASAVNNQCQIAGTGPTPIQTERRPGHNTGNSRNSGASTSEKRIGSSGIRPGGAMVKRRESMSA